MSDLNSDTERLDTKPSHESLSVLIAVKRLNRPRIIVFSIILLVALLLTMGKPKVLLDHFGESDVQLVSRIWITTSLAITISVSVWIYVRFIVRVGDVAKAVEDAERFSRIQSLQTKCGLLLLLIVVLAVVICLAALFWTSLEALRVISFGSGVGLVFLLIILDIHVAMISNQLLCEVESQAPDFGQCSAEETKEYSKKLAARRAEFIDDRDVVLKLDFPILIGVAATWGLAYVVLPGVLDLSTQAYAYGFATGATALQIIVGNVAFEVIGATPNT